MIKRCIIFSLILLYTPFVSGMNGVRTAAIRALFRQERLRRLQAALKDNDTTAAQTLINQIESIKKARNIAELQHYDKKKQPTYTPSAGEHVGC